MYAVGQKVMVQLPDIKREDAFEPNVGMLRKYDGMVSAIARRVSVPKSNCVYYELKGMKSEGYGIPFGFIEEWLIPVRSIKRAKNENSDGDNTDCND